MFGKTILAEATVQKGVARLLQARKLLDTISTNLGEGENNKMVTESLLREAKLIQF